MNKDNYKKIIKFIGLIVSFIAIVFLYGYMNMVYNIGLPCFTNKIFGIYCPGCGLTRAGIAMMNFDFYQALRYNAFSIIVIPLLVIVFVCYIWEYVFGRNSFISKIPVWSWLFLFSLICIFGIVRNFVPILQPIELQ